MCILRAHITWLEDISLEHIKDQLWSKTWIHTEQRNNNMGNMQTWTITEFSDRMEIVSGTILAVIVFSKLGNWQIFTWFSEQCFSLVHCRKNMVVALHALCKDRTRNISKSEICFEEWNKIEIWIRWIMKAKYINF